MRRRNAWLRLYHACRSNGGNRRRPGESIGSLDILALKSRLKDVSDVTPILDLARRGGASQFLCAYRDDALSSERGCVVLDQPQHSRRATRARLVRRTSPVTALRL